MRKKVWQTTLIAVALTLSMWTGHAEARNPECRFGTGARAVKRTIWCVTNKLNESAGFRSYALYVAQRESRFDAGAVNPFSGTCGVFQHQPLLWPSRYRDHQAPVRFGSMGPSCLNGRTNVIVSLLMAHRGSWSPWR